METVTYMDELVKRLEANFDIEYNKQLDNIKFNFAAEYNQRSAKFMMMKKTEIYAYKNYEYMFYKALDGKLNIGKIKELKKLIKGNIGQIVNIDEEHMMSVVTFILSGEEKLDKETEIAVKKFKFYKSFALGFKGWVNTKLIYVNTKDGEVTTNRYAKKDKKSFTMNN